MNAERSPSPSPVRRNIMRDMARDQAAAEEDVVDDDDDDEDEETLQLQLRALQTKIKLNKLNKQKAKKAALEQESQHVHLNSAQRRSDGERRQPPPPPSVEVPTSPVRSERRPEEQLSPARRRLGLTCNPRAEDISLKRARDPRSLHRAQPSTPSVPARDVLPRPLSFNERLAETKEKASLRQARHDRLSALRSTGFSKASTATAVLVETPQQKASKARRRAEDMVQNSLDAQSGTRTGHAPLSSEDEDEDSLNIDHNNSEGYDPFSKIHLKKRHIPHPVVAREMSGKEVYTLPRLLREVKSPDYDAPDCESDFVVFAILASKSSPLDHAQTHKTSGNNPLEPAKNKFMVLKLIDLKWEIDCFLFGTAFTHFWKLTPGTLLAILNPAVLPPKGNQHNGKFSLKLGSSEDAVMEIGVARDWALCSAIKKDGQGCEEWVDKRKSEACEFHVSLMVDKARKHRMEVNTMWRDPEGNSSYRTQSRAAVRGGGRGGRKGPGSYSREYGMLYSVPKTVAGGRSTASAMDRDDMDALNGMGKEEASRRRIANAQRERDLARSLGELGNGVGAAYLQASTNDTPTRTNARVERVAGGTAGARDRADAAREELFKKPSAKELGLLGNVPEDKRLSPPKERKSHFGLGLGATGTMKNSHISTAVGWGNSTKSSFGHSSSRKEIPVHGIGDDETGNPSRRELPLPGEDSRTRTKIRPRSQEGSSMRSQRSADRSPVKKRARLLVPGGVGVREPGRESWGGENGGNDDDDDDDELEII